MRPVQIFGQVRNRLRPLWERPERFAQEPPPGFPGCRWPEERHFLPPGAQNNTRQAIETGQFTFLNQEARLGWPPQDWDAAGLTKLWQYNLHYFEWLWALDYEATRTIVLDWIARYGLAKGRVGWDAYPTSLRLMNWCAVCFGRFRAQTENDPDFARCFWRSAFVQAEWLARHIETHLMGNHLFENGAALAFLGSCFAGETGQRWLARGLAILRNEIAEQILPDGMHFERSPMYHIRVAYVLRLLLDTGSDVLRQRVTAPLAAMRKALPPLCHPDGQIALLNDSAFAVQNNPAQLCAPASAGMTGVWALPNAGYYGWRGADGSYVVCDAGLIGPDYIPGHAHGDIFSFELSIRGCRVIVDSGAYDYVPGAMREYCRSTRAHNTVEINGQDQCEFWGAFRVARRGRPRDVLWQPTSDGFTLTGWHDGYRRLPGRPMHYRTFEWRAGNRLEVHDRIKSDRAVTAISRLHFHPDCHVECADGRDCRVVFPEGALRIAFTGSGELSRENAWYCPEFGCRRSNAALVFASKGKEIETGYRIVSLE